MYQRAGDKNTLVEIVLTDCLIQCHRYGDERLSRACLTHAGNELHILIQHGIHQHALLIIEWVNANPFGNLNANTTTENQTVYLAIPTVTSRLTKLSVAQINVFVDI